MKQALRSGLARQAQSLCISALILKLAGCSTESAGENDDAGGSPPAVDASQAASTQKPNAGDAASACADDVNVCIGPGYAKWDGLCARPIPGANNLSVGYVCVAQGDDVGFFLTSPNYVIDSWRHGATSVGPSTFLPGEQERCNEILSKYVLEKSCNQPADSDSGSADGSPLAEDAGQDASRRRPDSAPEVESSCTDETFVCTGPGFTKWGELCGHFTANPRNVSVGFVCVAQGDEVGFLLMSQDFVVETWRHAATGDLPSTLVPGDQGKCDAILGQYNLIETCSLPLDAGT